MRKWRKKLEIEICRQVTHSPWSCHDGVYYYVTRSSEMSHLSIIFNFEFSTPYSCNLKMLHVEVNPIRIECLVTELWAIYQYWKQYETQKNITAFFANTSKTISATVRCPTHSPWSCHILSWNILRSTFKHTLPTACFQWGLIKTIHTLTQWMMKLVGYSKT